MKRIAFAILTLLLTVAVYPQTIIENPKYGFDKITNVHPDYTTRLTRIEITDTSTVLSFHTTFIPGQSMIIPKTMFIQPVNSDRKLFVTGSEGIPFCIDYTIPESGQVDYKLIFPKIDTSVSRIDYGEDNEGHHWFMYDIQVKPEMFPSNVPQELIGNWFNNETYDWELSFFDTLAVYKKQMWNYSKVNLKDGNGSVKLKSKNKIIELFIKNNNNDNCMIGETLKSLKRYCNDGIVQSKMKIKNDKPYQAPIFKIDSATYSGSLIGYNPRFGAKTGMIYIDDIITGEQKSFLYKISDDGTFSVKLPIYYPHSVYVGSGLFNGSVFLEPGKQLFHMIYQGDRKNNSLFMGESAKINADLSRIKKINNFDYSKLFEKITDMSSAQYKAYCMDLRQKDLDSLEVYNSKHLLRAKAYQVKRLDIEYSYANILLSYSMHFEYAYRNKHQIPWDQPLPVKPDSLTANYYNFITDEFVNNPLAVLSTEYDHFINYFKYQPILRPSGKSFYSMLGIVEELERIGYKFTDEERKMADALKDMESPEIKAAQAEFSRKYGDKIDELNNKYKDKLRKLIKKQYGNPISTAMIENFLIKEGVSFTDQEKEQLKVLKEHENSCFSITYQKLIEQHPDAINQFYLNHQEFLDSIFIQKTMNTRNENLDKILHLHKGLASDIMDAQDFCRSIVSEMTPVSKKEIKTIQQQISTPFIARYINDCNEQTKAKIKVNKTKTDYTVNEVPKTEADKLFDSMMKKYRGKVVFVDFWATWCGPCRAGIAEMKPLKEELANENVVFVYITNETSPKKTWENMIPDIKGEHFRVSKDEWNYFTSKFNIAGIPHYALVNKDGVVINPNLMQMSNEALKIELKKHLVK
jgi:thiol-disulfide isomerase/thioredoxin/predicted transcriptional regulator with HTH domain